jgi:N-acetylglucosamine-6-phosphate deacetylase
VAAVEEFHIGGTLLSGGRELAGTVVVEGDRVARVVAGRPGADDVDMLHDGYVAPGLCDLQVNGAGGHSATGDEAAVDALEERLLQAGVTSYLPTVITLPADLRLAVIERLARRVADPRSPAAGIHLEGPLLNPEMARVHDPRLMEDAAEGLPEGFDDPAVRLVTIAPEVPGGRGAVRVLSGRGVTVSLGHSAAGAEEALAAVDAGARAVTHLFNAMPPLHHRAPGLVGAALADERVTLMVIADNVHVDPLVLALVDRAGGDRVALVSDATAAAGAPEGRYRLAGAPIERRGDVVVDAEGRLSGSALLLDRCVRRWQEATGCSPAEAWAAGSDRPAALVGLEHGLSAGVAANLVLLSRDLEVERVMFRGEWVA